MKKKAPTLVFSGVFLIIATLIYSGCSHSPNQLVFEQDQTRYVIDRESSSVLEYTPEGEILNILGYPGAGQALEAFYLSPDQEILPPENVRMAIQQVIRLLILYTKGSISGLVWNDLNGNQIIDVGEQGLQDIMVFVDNDNSSTFTDGDNAALTNADGFYTIPKVKAGTKAIYIDIATLPQGFNFTTNHPIIVDLEKGQKIINADFAVQDQSGYISGTIWDQTDNVPMPGVIIYVDLNGDDTYSLGEPYDTSSLSGKYLIANVTAGTHKVHIDNGTLNVKYLRTPVSGSNPTEITLIAGGSASVNFTYAHKATISGILQDTNGTLWRYIRLFIDLNGNGVYDEGEPIARTDELGNYIFDELYQGSYTILIYGNLPQGYDIGVSPGPVEISEGENISDTNFFTYAKPAAISSFAWDDANGNGKREIGEIGLEGITVFLDTNNNGILDTDEQFADTDSEGSYSFTDLEPGFYTIHINDSSLSNEYFPTTAPNPVHRKISTGQTYDGAKFGYQKKLEIVHALQYPIRLSWGEDNKLYVSDNQNNSVFIYDSDLNVQGELKGLSKPLGVKPDSTGNIYVGNRGRSNVEVYDSSGNMLKSIGDGNILIPNDITFDRNNNIYILDSANNTVLVYDQDHKLISTIGNALQLNYPVSFAIYYRDDGAGNEVGELYVADQRKCTIHVFTLDGTYIRGMGSCGSMYTHNWNAKFSGLMGVDVDQYGNVHGLDNNLNVVQVFNPENGAFLTSYNAYLVPGTSLINIQTDIAINPNDNRVIISNVATKNVESVHTVP